MPSRKKNSRFFKNCQAETYNNRLDNISRPDLSTTDFDTPSTLDFDTTFTPGFDTTFTPDFDTSFTPDFDTSFTPGSFQHHHDHTYQSSASFDEINEFYFSGKLKPIGYTRHVIDIQTFFDNMRCSRCDITLKLKDGIGILPDGLCGHLIVRCYNCNDFVRVAMGKTHNSSHGPRIFDVNTKLATGKNVRNTKSNLQNQNLTSSCEKNMALKAYVNIVVVNVYLTTAFNIRCPNPLERNVRSKALCTDAHNYTCLFDENLMSYRESCHVKFDFQRPGYRVTLRTNLHAEACPDYLYQPVIFLSNESSNCEWKKSFCRKEGQLLSSNGTIKTDRQCRCNYDDGYTFVAEPKDVCYCVPSVEDCSCYRKQCSTKQSISPDHHCIDNFTWTQNFTCLSISDVAVVVELQVSNVTGSGNYTDASHEEKGKRKVLRTSLICLILFEIFLLIICSSIIIFVENFCTGFNTTSSFSNARTEHTERNTIHELYFETDDIKIVIGKLAVTDYILLWGKAGCGKTTVMCKLADYYETDLGYKRITCFKPSEIFVQQCVTEKSIFVFDDIFGRFDFSYEKVLRLKECEKHFKNFFVENNVKLLMTCSSVAFMNDSVQELCLFTDHTFELTKTSLPPNNKNTDSKNVQKVSKQTTLHQSDIRSKARLETLRKSHYESWCCLFICILKQGCIDDAYSTNDDDHVFNEFMIKVCNELKIDFSQQQFWNHLPSLIGTFIKKEKRLFSIIDSSVFEALAVYFGQELQPELLQLADPEIITQHCYLTSCPVLNGNGMFRIQVNEENEELYFRRIKEQLLRIYLSEVFSVQQMESESYRLKLAVLLENLETNELKQINNSTCKIRNETALTLTSKYVRLSKIFFEAKK